MASLTTINTQTRRPMGFRDNCNCGGHQQPLVIQESAPVSRVAADWGLRESVPKLKLLRNASGFSLKPGTKTYKPEQGWTRCSCVRGHLPRVAGGCDSAISRQFVRKLNVRRYGAVLLAIGVQRWYPTEPTHSARIRAAHRPHLLQCNGALISPIVVSGG